MIKENNYRGYFRNARFTYAPAANRRAAAVAMKRAARLLQTLTPAHRKLSKIER